MLASMDLLPFGQLSPFKPRRFVPLFVNWSAWSEIEPLFDRLEHALAACQSGTDLEQWLVNWSELSAALDEENSRRHIAMTCHTENVEAEKAYLYFVEEIEPRLKPREFKLSQLYLGHPQREQLLRERYEVFDRETKVSVELFREENVPLETEEAKLDQQYQKLSGSLTVKFRGEEKTLPQMTPFLEEPDRALRQEAWETVARRRMEVAGQFDDLYDQLLGLRKRIAANAGCPNYVDYVFKSHCRFDYTADDCRHFHDAIEEEVMPALRELHARRKQQLQLPVLRPWDMAVDPLNRPPLKPFKGVDRLLATTQNVFQKLDPELARGFQKMQDLRLLDLANRKGKAPGGYQSTLHEARLPFIFMNAVGVQRDVETMLHEAGHAFHALATQTDDLYHYRHAPIEFCEVASMSMELLGNQYLEEFYPRAEANRARRDHLEGIVKFLPWMAIIDAFQHWIYLHPEHTRAERTIAWVGLMQRFGEDVDWSGYEDVRSSLWHRQLHIFVVPLYYVEYGIAQLGALQVWANSKRDRSGALANYRKALALGGSKPLPQLFATAGCRFDFSKATLRPLMTQVREELESLN